MAELEHFAGPVRAELAEVGDRLNGLLSAMTAGSALPDLYARYVDPPVRHLFLSQGKLLRPLLVLLSARASRKLPEPLPPVVIRAAAAVELLHTASLAHDDMVDAAGERRGIPSLHRAFGATSAVLVGDLLYSRFFHELASLPSTSAVLRVQVLDLFLDVTARMCEGEILEEEMRCDGTEPSFEAYLHVTETKTACLVSACCRAGALLGGGAEKDVEALAGYGRSLGMLFQIADDLADGDAPLADRALLAATAEKYRRNAESVLGDLPPGEAAAMLAELPGHIMAPMAR